MGKAVKPADAVEVDLVFAAARLSRSSDAHWSQFMQAFSAYATQSAQNCIQSPLDQLQRMQGHAQAVSRLRDMLAACRESADAIESKRK